MDNIKEVLIEFWHNLKKIDWKIYLHRLDLAIQIIRRVVLNFFAWGILLFGFLLGVGVGYVASIIKEEAIPTVSEMNKLIHDVDQTSTLYFADNSSMGEIQSDIVSYKTKSSDISPWVKKAIVASEDEEFYLHRGVMPRAVIRAALSDITGFGIQSGGSTITQQLVKMQILSSETTFKRKATEIFLAIRLSKFFSKDDILTSYLNVASFGRNNKGENVTGIGAASVGIFGKEPKDLTIAQSAFIVGLVQSPYAYTPFDSKGNIDKKTVKYGLKREQVVLFRMYRNGAITKKQLEDAKKQDLKVQFLKSEESTRHKSNYGYTYSAIKEQSENILTEVLMRDDGLNPDNEKDTTYSRYYSTAKLKLSQSGYKVYTTINKTISDNMQEILTKTRSLFSETHTDSVYDQQKNDFIKFSEPVQNGSVILDNKTGGVLGFTGGVDFKLNEFNHAFNNRRSPGSSIKPLLVFAPAIDSGIVGSHSVLADFPAKYGDYEPTDYDQTYQNRFVSVTESLSQSYNISTVNLYQSLMQKDSKLAKSYMEKMDFKITDKEYSELGISLGGTASGFSPLQEAAAYATFANDGIYQKPYVISKIIDPTGRIVYEHKSHPVKVYSEATAYIMRKMLGEVVQNGTAELLGDNVKFDSTKLYGKTGTSNDSRDYWFTGSTPGITISSWIGYDNLYNHTYNLSEEDSNANLRLIARFFNNIYDTDQGILKLNDQKNKPNGVKDVQVLASTGTLPGVLKNNLANFSMKGRTISSLYAQGGPKELSENFGIGGYASDYRLFWSHYFGQENGYGLVSKATKDMKYNTSDPKVYFSYYEQPRFYIRRRSSNTSGGFNNNSYRYGNSYNGRGSYTSNNSNNQSVSDNDSDDSE